MVPKSFTPIMVAMIAGVSIWLLSEQAPKESRLIVKDNTVPDAYMEDFTTYVMGENGKPRHELHASYMAHFSFDNHSELTSPQVIYYQLDESPWVMSAERGITKDDSKKIILQGNVTIFRQHSVDGGSGLKINTSELLISPDDSYAETDQLITVTDGEHQLQSTGIRAYFKDGRIELLSQVRGKYVL